MGATRIEELLEGAVARGVFPGVVAVVGDRDGTLFEGAFGQAAPDTMFRLASMTKAIVSVAALQLIEQGQLELDRPVADLVPEFGELAVLEGFDGETPRLRPPARPATIRQLLTHTSGAGYAFGNEQLLRYYQVTGTPDPITGRLASLRVPLVADPGTRWEYGLSTDWLGQVIERVGGLDLQAYCREHVCGPLGMSDTTFDPDPEQRLRMMELHTRTPDGGLAAITMESTEVPEYWSGGHGASATAGDYLRFMRMLMRGGELDGVRVLRPETVDAMFTDQIEGIPVPEEMRSAMPELSNDVPRLPFAQGFGLGLHVFLEDIPGMRRAGSGDWSGLFNCFYWIDRTSGLAAALLTQVLPFFDAGIVETLAGFEQAVYAELREPATA